jgi:hypothetical protein
MPGDIVRQFDGHFHNHFDVGKPPSGSQLCLNIAPPLLIQQGNVFVMGSSPEFGSAQIRFCQPTDCSKTNLRGPKN